MNQRVNTIACALLMSALVVPASQAGDQRAPVKRHQIVAHARSNAFAGLGVEGSGLRKVASGRNAFAGLGVEGSGLRKIASGSNAFAGLGVEGSGLAAK